MTRVSPSSSPRSRYLPDRPIVLMVWPSSRARKCLALGWRLTVQPFRTSTALIFRPTTSPCRSRRIVSTSGSSGILSFPFITQRSTGNPGGFLFGILLRSPLPRSEVLVSNVHRGSIPPGMIGAPTGHFVPGNPPTQAHGCLLEATLVIRLAGFGDRGLDTVSQQFKDDPLDFGEASIEIDGAKNRLDGVGQDRLLFAPPRKILTPAQAQ